MSGITYMVTSHWRGSLNIGNMRAFDDELSAMNYAEGLVRVGEFEARIYSLTENEKPQLLYKFHEDNP